VAPRSAPPVMARSSVFTTVQAQNKRTKKTRRRFDVALNAQGAEMRLPALPQIRFGWRLASFLLFAVLAFVFYTYLNSPMYRVEAVKIVGLQRLNSEMINTALGARGKQVFMLDANSMHQGLTNAFPELSSVQVGIELPNSVVITVTERIPVVIWLQGGRTMLVDNEGMSFPAREGLASLEIPSVEAADSPPAPPGAKPLPPPQTVPELSTLIGEDGLPPTSTVYAQAQPLLTKDMVAAVLMIAEKAPADAALIFNGTHGLGWKDKRGWEVYLGGASDIEVKLRIYRAILDYLKGQDARPTIISVEHIDAPYYRAEPQAES